MNDGGGATEWWMVERMGSQAYRSGGSVALQICCRSDLFWVSKHVIFFMLISNSKEWLVLIASTQCIILATTLLLVVNLLFQQSYPDFNLMFWMRSFIQTVIQMVWAVIYKFMYILLTIYIEQCGYFLIVGSTGKSTKF